MPDHGPVDVTFALGLFQDAEQLFLDRQDTTPSEMGDDYLPHIVGKPEAAWGHG